MMDTAWSTKNELDFYILTLNKYKFTVFKEDLRPEKRIGTGYFGIVYKASVKERLFAIKQIDKNSNASLEKIQKEIDVSINFANEPDIGNLIYAIDCGEDRDNYYIAMPYFDQGNLSHFLIENQLQEIEALEYFRQICYGYSILYKHKIMHRNITTDNILVSQSTDKNYPYKYIMSIADLGIIASATNELHSIDIGNPYTSAPEVRTGNYTEKVDIYSLGCVLFKMLTGKEPFQASTLHVRDVQALKEKELINIEHVSCFTISLLEGMLQYSQDERMSFNELNFVIDATSIYTNYAIIKDKVEKIERSSKINKKQSMGCVSEKRNPNCAIFMRSFPKSANIGIPRKAVKAANIPCCCVII